jgi:hypothetical protein
MSFADYCLRHLVNNVAMYMITLEWSTNNVNKTCALLQTTGDKDEQNITTWNSERKDT